MPNPYEQVQAVIDIVAACEHAPEEIARLAAPKISDVLEQQAELGQDPYGAPWASLARNGSRSYLYDTGKMREGTDAVSAGPQIIASAPSPAEFHQSGTSRMPARPILPNDLQGLPMTWVQALQEAEREFEAGIQRRIGSAA